MNAIAVGLLALASQIIAVAIAEAEPAGDYVESIYRAIPTPGFDFHTLRYAPRLARLLKADRACEDRSGGICALGFVPFCGCQDTEANYRLLDRRLVAHGPRVVTVVVMLLNGRRRRFDVDLQESGRVWRVSDIHADHMPSLVDLLEAKSHMRDRGHVHAV